MLLESNCICREHSMEVCNNSRFPSQKSSFIPKLNSGKHIANLVNTNETIFVVFFTNVLSFKKTFDASFLPRKSVTYFMSYISEPTPHCQFLVPSFIGTRYKCNFNIDIFIAIALNQSIFLNVLHFPMKIIKLCDLEATPMGGATSKPASDVVCLLLLA